MGKLINLKQYRLSIFLLCSLLALAVAYAITKTNKFHQNSSLLSFGITFDLAIFIPIIFYYLIVRYYKISIISCLGISTIMLFLASFILPKNQHQYIDLIGNFRFFIEPILILFFINRIKKIHIEYKNQALLRSDFIKNLEVSLSKSLSLSKKSTAILVSELAIIRYGLLFFLGKKEYKTHQKTYTLHQNSGIIAIIITLLVVIIIETIAVHFLVNRWNHSLAIIFLLSSIYTAIFLVAFANSLIKRPVLLENNMLIIRIGLLWRTEIALKNVKKIVLLNSIEQPNKQVLNLAKPFISPNILIETQDDFIIEGILGIQKKIKKVTFYVDENKKLQQDLQSYFH